MPHPVPDDSLPDFPAIDKLIHAIMFGGMSAALMFDQYRRKNVLTPAVITAICSGVAAFGVFDEMVQEWLSNGRSYDPLDILADCGGIIIAAFTAPPVIKRLFQKK